MASVTFPPAQGGDGSTVTDDANPTTGLANGGHRTRFVPALAQVVQMAITAVAKALEASNSATAALNSALDAGNSASLALNNPATSTTSTTSLAIGSGSKSLTVGTGKSFYPGMTLKIYNSTTAYMVGTVTSYNSGTGALVVSVDLPVGSGTFASWTVGVYIPVLIADQRVFFFGLS